MQRLFRGSFATLLVSLVLSASPASAQVGFWSFDDLLIGVPTPFSQTKSGITANFSTVAGPLDAFAIGSSFFTTLTGTVLLSANGASNRLGIGFNRVIDSLDLAFALNTQVTTDPFLVQSFLGANLVGSLAAFGTLRASGFVEGSFVTRGTSFDRVVISSLAPDFAIDRLNARVTTTPEPDAWLLMAVGLAGIAIAHRRTRRQTYARMARRRLSACPQPEWVHPAGLPRSRFLVSSVGAAPCNRMGRSNAAGEPLLQHPSRATHQEKTAGGRAWIPRVTPARYRQRRTSSEFPPARRLPLPHRRCRLTRFEPPGRRAIRTRRPRAV
jgi:hypothetical protein